MSALGGKADILSAPPYAKIYLSGDLRMVRAFAKVGPMNTIRKFILVAAATAVATSFLPTFALNDCWIRN